MYGKKKKVTIHFRSNTIYVYLQLKTQKCNSVHFHINNVFTYRQVCRKDKNGTIHFYNNKVFTYIEQTNKNGTVRFYWPKTAREEDRQPRIMDQQQEHEMRVQLGRERGVRLKNEGRETARLQIIELTKMNSGERSKRCREGGF